jgi:hypothetical protein
VRGGKLRGAIDLPPLALAGDRNSPHRITVSADSLPRYQRYFGPRQHSRAGAVRCESRDPCQIANESRHITVCEITAGAGRDGVVSHGCNPAWCGDRHPGATQAENYGPNDVWAFLKDGDRQSVQGWVRRRLGPQVARQSAQANDADYKSALFSITAQPQYRRSLFGQ